jgi:tetraacyldisaccharide 4'-kinase
MMQEIILRAWRRKNALFCFVLVPLSWVFALLIWLRRLCYQFGILKSHALPVPVVVVGNINMGGSGKTPVVMWLVKQLKAKGFYPGVISRGYGAKITAVTSVVADSNAADIGDEPLLIAKRCDCPVWVGANRVQAGLALLKAHPECNVIISDDGLQHYRLKRNVEIAVVSSDALGNRRLLPAGPLREPVKRLDEVDAIIFNGEKTIAEAFEMQLVGEQFYNLADETVKATAADFKRKSIKAFAGIGNPERFFEHLRKLGLSFAGVSFDDHYAFSPEDLANFDCDVLLMTEKDAVKCKPFAVPHHWVLPVEASIDGALLDKVLEMIAKK